MMGGGQFLRDVVANILDCDIIVSKFKLQLHYYVHCQNKTFGKGMNLLIPLLWFKQYTAVLL